MRIGEGISSYYGYRDYGGRLVSQAEFDSAIEQLELSSTLGLLASLSMEQFQLESSKSDLTAPEYQGKYLGPALVDDFPEPLPGVAKMVAPGRVPITGGRHTFLHPQNLAYLAHSAILRSERTGGARQVDRREYSRVLRLLLIANDLIDQGGSPASITPGNLHDARSLSLNLLRGQQFFAINTFHMLMEDAARQLVVLRDFVPRHFPQLRERFTEATNGVDLEDYFGLLVLLAAHFRFERAYTDPFIIRSHFFKELSSGTDLADRVFNRWICSTSSYQAEHESWAATRPAGSTTYDLVVLRETPFVEIAPDIVVCPHIPFLAAKIVDEPYFLIEDYLLEQEKNQFRTSIGLAYEDYAHQQVTRIAHNDRGGAWTVHQDLRGTSQGGNWQVDSYLQRGSVGVAFEHKAIRPSTEFLRGGEGDNVLGPPDHLLEAVIDGTATLQQGMNHRTGDKSLLTRGLWQLTNSEAGLVESAHERAESPPETLYPLISHLARLALPDLVVDGYIAPMSGRANLLTSELWRHPQWLEIRHLEALAALAERGELNLEDLLYDKTTREPARRIDAYLYDYYRDTGGQPVNRILEQEWKDLLDHAASTYFPDQTRGHPR